MFGWFSWARVGAALGAIALGALAILKIRQGGADAERVRQAERAAQQRRQGDAIENRVDAAGDAELEQLRDKWTRP